MNLEGDGCVVRPIAIRRRHITQIPIRKLRNCNLGISRNIAPGRRTVIKLKRARARKCRNLNLRERIPIRIGIGAKIRLTQRVVRILNNAD